MTLAASDSPAAAPVHWADVLPPARPGVLGVVTRRRVASAWAWREGLAVTVAAGLHRHGQVQLVLADGQAVAAELAGIDEATDLAVLRAPAVRAPPLTPSDRVPRLGDALAVLGRQPSGEAHASFGHVGLVGPAWRTWLGARVDHRVRLDGGLFPGLPGGPVLDAAGRVIGLASAALGRHHGTLLPTATVTRVVQALAERGAVPRARLGVALQAAAARVEGSVQPGLLVTHVSEGGAADAAGILVGDLVVEAGGRSTGDLAALRDALDSLAAGAALPMTVARGGTRVPLQAGPWGQA
ncbi:MAG: S1C family serine protease [Rubrivivax sp.]